MEHQVVGLARSWDGKPWTSHPEAAALVAADVEEFLKQNPVAREFAERLQREAFVDFGDILEHIRVWGEEHCSRLLQCGFVCEEVAVEDEWSHYYHPRADLPRYVISTGAVRSKKPTHILTAAIKCDSLSDFAKVNRCSIHGELGGISSMAVIKSDRSTPAFFAAERYGTRDTSVIYMDIFGYDMQVMPAAYVTWKNRNRNFPLGEELAGLNSALLTAQQIVKTVGKDIAASLIMQGERAYWESRCEAGRRQKARLDALGIGWNGPQDHHTFRSSRHCFRKLIEIFETLGFHCRERFYAGAEAGWGAQVMENPVAGITIFADVDLAPDEVGIDFAHTDLPLLPHLGTVGLWCALHGESILQGGMHHLEIKCRFDDIRAAEIALGSTALKPFNDTPDLRQCFSAYEFAKVDPARLRALLAVNQITPEEFQNISSNGAKHSHIEYLSRRNGFKGFISSGVSEIIRDSDPRKH